MKELEINWYKKLCDTIKDYENLDDLSIIGTLDIIKKMLCDVCLSSEQSKIPAKIDIEFAIVIFDLFKEGVNDGLKPVVMIALINNFIIHPNVIGSHCVTIH